MASLSLHFIHNQSLSWEPQASSGPQAIAWFACLLATGLHRATMGGRRCRLWAPYVYFVRRGPDATANATADAMRRPAIKSIVHT